MVSLIYNIEIQSFTFAKSSDPQSLKSILNWASLAGLNPWRNPKMFFLIIDLVGACQSQAHQYIEC